MAPLTNNPSQASLALPPLTDPSILHVQDTVNQIRLIANRVLELKARPDLSEQDRQQLSIDQKKLLGLKIMLRGFNREMYLQNRAVKTSTSEAKAEVDNLYLNLQNLKYEQQHLRSEIQDCRSYVTLYTDVDLIDEQEFIAQHPEYIGLEGHELMVKRLEDEAQQRIELEAKRKELVNRRTQMQADSKTRKNDLDQLTETLKKFIESATPISEVLQKY